MKILQEIPNKIFIDPCYFKAEKKFFEQNAFLNPKNIYSDDINAFTFNFFNKLYIVPFNEDKQYLIENRCLHRGSALTSHGLSCSKLVCPYHGWRYDFSGKLLSPNINIENNSISSKKLSCFHNILQLSNRAHNIDPKTFNILKDIQHAALIDYSLVTHKCNWKIIVENVLESYHLSHVHQKTFARDGFRTSSKVDYFFNHLSSGNTIYNNKNKSSFYEHHFLFPNAFCSNTNNQIFFYSFLSPISQNETHVYYFLFINKANALKLSPKRLEIVKNASSKFTKNAILEDKNQIEQIQNNITHESSFVITDKEPRIDHFYQSYKKNIKEI